MSSSYRATDVAAKRRCSAARRRPPVAMSQPSVEGRVPHEWALVRRHVISRDGRGSVRRLARKVSPKEVPSLEKSDLTTRHWAHWPGEEGAHRQLPEVAAVARRVAPFLRPQW